MAQQTTLHPYGGPSKLYSFVAKTAFVTIDVIQLTNVAGANPALVTVVGQNPELDLVAGANPALTGVTGKP